MGIPSTLVTMGIASPIVDTDDPAVNMPPGPADSELQPLAAAETVLPM